MLAVNRLEGSHTLATSASAHLTLAHRSTIFSMNTRTLKLWGMKMESNNKRKATKPQVVEQADQPDHRVGR